MNIEAWSALSFLDWDLFGVWALGFGISRSTERASAAAGNRRKKCSLLKRLRCGDEGVPAMKSGRFSDKAATRTNHHMTPPRHLLRLIGAGAFSLLLGGASLPAATLPPGFTEVQVATGLTNATAMSFSPDGRLFVCQQAGALRVISGGALLPTPFATVPRPQPVSVDFWESLSIRILPPTGSSMFTTPPLPHDPQSRQPFYREHCGSQCRGSRKRGGYSRPG